MAATEDMRKDYFFAQYTADFGAIKADDERALGRAQTAYQSFTKRWDDEKAYHTGSMWGAFNAYSGLVQHDLKARGADDVVRVERRQDSNLFGLGSRRTQAALQSAMTMAAAATAS